MVAGGARSSRTALDEQVDGGEGRVMKILRLDLLAFGPFSNAPSLNLEAGKEGLQLVYGPNEAGKSSALRALRCLFFGIPGQTTDDFRHRYDKLRIGATLQDLK